MTIKELFGHAIGVAKFPDFAKFYNWLTKRDHTLKGDITFTGEVNFADATVTGLPSGGDGIYGGSGVVSDGTYATLEGAFRFQTEAEDNNYLSIAPYDDGLGFSFLTTSVEYDRQVTMYLNPEEAVYIRTSSISIPGKSTELSISTGSIWLVDSNGVDAQSRIEISNGQILISINGDLGTSGQVLKKDVNNEVAWGDPRPYKVYTALLTQSGTNAPVATVLENTLGAVPVWSRTAAGTYGVTLTNGFTITKTTVDAFLYRNSPSNFLDTITIQKISDSVIEVLTFATFGAPIDGGSFQVEIRVYN